MTTLSYTTIHSGYKLSAYRFQKRSRTSAEYTAQPFRDAWFKTRHWKTERIFNVAKALQLLADRTRIPISKFIQCGQNDDGSMFLEMSRVDGIDLSEVGKKCQEPGGMRHNDSGKYSECKNIAKANAELAKLRSNRTGLDGFVLPPAWMLEYDTRSHWDVKTSSRKEVVFIDGYLGPDNLRLTRKPSK